MTKKFSADAIIAAGSTDGILASAALSNFLGGVETIIFTQAFAVNGINVDDLPEGAKVAFVDLAVNNSKDPVIDQSTKEQLFENGMAMTADLVKRIEESGRTIVAIADEHNRDHWKEVMGEKFDDLFIKPETRSDEFSSSGAVILAALGDQLSDHAKALCQGATDGDKMNFTGLAGIVNSGVKSRIADNTRRVYMANHFAQNSEADETINGWVAEYEEILATNKAVIAAGEKISENIIFVDAVGKRIDMTSLMFTLYEDYSIVAVKGESYNKAAGKKVVQVSFGVKRGFDFNALETLQNAGVPASGIPGKANVPVENADEAFNVLKSALAAA